MPRIDELLASVIKGATEAGASVEQLTIGREEKLANHGALGGALGSLAGEQMLAAPFAGAMGGAAGAAAGADEGRGLHAAGGALGGGVLGSMLGGMIPGAGALGSTLGGMGGAALGGHLMGKQEGLLDRIRGKFSSAEDAYLAGSAAAARQYKVAFAPLIGAGLSMLAPAAARFGLGRLAGGALGKAGGGMLGRAATGVANFAKKPVGGALFDAGTSMAAQSAMS